MVSPNLLKQALLQQKQGIRESVQGKEYVDGIPQDGRFQTHLHDACLDSQGKVSEVDIQRTYQAECGDYLDSEGSFGGRCKLDHFVCRHHIDNCPRNHPLGSFDWKTTPRIRPCLKRCWLIINIRRVLYWLFTVPEKKETSDGQETVGKTPGTRIY